LKAKSKEIKMKSKLDKREKSKNSTGKNHKGGREIFFADCFVTEKLNRSDPRFKQGRQASRLKEFLKNPSGHGSQANNPFFG
jgi:hypothetical protein